MPQRAGQSRKGSQFIVIAATKGAVDAISLILAKELRGRDITVNAIAPDPTATELFFDGKDQATIDRMAKMNPLERLGTPGDIAEVVPFLAGAGRWINGQVVYPTATGRRRGFVCGGKG